MRDRRPPEELTPDELKARMIQNARSLYREAEEVIAVGEWWANNRTDCEPIDFEWARLVRANALKVLNHFGVKP